MAAHIIDGEFQSDKYPTTPRGKVPLSVKDPTAQDLLWEYAQRRRAVDAEFSDDLETALRTAGYVPRGPRGAVEYREALDLLAQGPDMMLNYGKAVHFKAVGLTEQADSLRAECLAWSDAITAIFKREADTAVAGHALPFP